MICKLVNCNCNDDVMIHFTCFLIIKQSVRWSRAVEILNTMYLQLELEAC